MSLVEEYANFTGEAYDVALHRDCKGLRQRCTAPVPELFHHHKVVGEEAIGVEGEAVTQDLDWYMNRHKWTLNIEWSARCNAAGTGEKLGKEDKWQCEFLGCRKPSASTLASNA